MGERTLLAGGPSSPFGRLEAIRLSHGVDSYGYRLTEPDGRRMLPDLLAARGVRGPRISELQRLGRVETDDGAVTLEEVSEHRPGQVFAFVMDTRVCQGVYDLAANADMLVIESTFLTTEAALAAEHGHMTARQAATVAKECGVRTLVLTHFSQRYTDPAEFEREAREVFDGELHVAADLMRVPVPKRANG
jgi:ribonuclease Z